MVRNVQSGALVGAAFSHDALRVCPVVRCARLRHRLDRLDHFVREWAIPFSAYLHTQNRLDGAVAPVPFDSYLKAQDHARDAGGRRPCPHPRSLPKSAKAPPVIGPTRARKETAPPRCAEQDPLLRAPRLGDVPSAEETGVARQVQLVYQVRIPFEPGRIFDIFA